MNNTNKNPHSYERGFLLAEGKGFEPLCLSANGFQDFSRDRKIGNVWGCYPTLCDAIFPLAEPIFDGLG